jgi:hypothetical protein
MVDSSHNKTINQTDYQLEEQVSPASKRLTGFRAFLLFKTTITKYKTRPVIIPLRPGLFGLKNMKKNFSIHDLASESEAIILIPRREVTQRVKSQKGTTSSIGDRRYVLITFNPFRDDTLRQKANRLVWKTPLIRIRPGLMITPHIRVSRFRKYERILLRPSEYVQQLIELGKTVWYAPKLQLMKPNQEQTLKKLIQEIFEERSEFIIRSSDKLLKEAMESSNQPGWTKLARQQLNLLRNRLRLIRAQSAFFQREFGFNFQPIVTRTAAKVSRVKQKVLID